MTRGRLEAFSDGVIAILITIMVLELHPPHEGTWASLAQVARPFMAYVLSFVMLGIYWNNHHHMLHTVDSINGRILWANMHLLFWLSLIPFVTAWLGEHSESSTPTAAYGLVLTLAAIAYYILSRAIIAHQGPHSRLKAAVGKDRKGVLSIVIYLVALALTQVHTALSVGLYMLVAMIWLVPDRRIESHN